MHALSLGLSAPAYWLTRLVIQRGLGIVYLSAFVNAFNEFPALLGERGLVGAGHRLRPSRFLRAPSLFQLHYSDPFLRATAAVGIAASVSVIIGIPERNGAAAVSVAVWALLWMLYVSIVNAGQTFYAFGWESLLCEVGFLAIFLGPSTSAPSVLMIWLLRWVVVRLELGAGLIKLRGDPCWRDLTCLRYHHETQPMPNPLSWYFHNLPDPLHRIEVLGNHVAQLAAPVVLLLPQPLAGGAALLIIATQLWLVLSGNFAWLNALTIVLAFSGLDSAWLRHVLPVAVPASQPAEPGWLAGLSVAVTAGVLVLSWWPVRNMLSRHQMMNASFNTLHLVNTYGAFGSVTRVRNEVVIEGTDEPEVTPRTVWREYQFRGKPGDVARRPAQIAPYHLRLDWLMWFAALSRRYAEGWLVPLLVRLLRNDAATLRLLRRNPFPKTPPTHVRALLYRYRFTTPRERRETGAWWVRQLIGDYLPVLSARRD